MLDAKNCRVHISTGDMDYIRFGRGSHTLIMLPGVGDGLVTVKGKALPFALLYRKLAKDFTVYVFSRRVGIPSGMTTREMADDLNEAMEKLELPGAAVVGVSQGGMIAQWLAINHPDKVDKLVLTVTLARPNDVIKDVVGHWLDLADRGDYKGIMVDTAERSYSPARLKAARLEYKLLGSFGKPKSFDRFRVEAESCITHDAYDKLDTISCQVLVIGGTDDRIVTGQASEEMTERIPGSELYMYEGLGHGLYEEAPDFLTRVADFCR